MQSAGLVVVWATLASAQTAVDGNAVVGATTSGSGAVSALSAVELSIDRSLAPTVAVSAHVAVLLGTSPVGTFSFSDLSSSLQIRFRLPSWDASAVSLELFPFDGRRVRPTFDPANTWGAPLRPTSVAPVVKLTALHRGASIWAAVRGHQQLDNSTLETVLRWSGLLGGGVALPMGARAELIFSAADRGDIPALAMQGIPSSIFAGGGAARLGWDHGGGVAPSYDPAGFAPDPDRFARLFTREHYDLPIAASVSLEAGMASQNLRDPDVLDGVRRDLAPYLDVQSRVRLATLRLFLTLRFRQVGLINFDAPGLPPYSTFQKAAITQDEYSALAGADFRLSAVGLTPGLAIRIVRPATLKTPGVIFGSSLPVDGNVIVLQGLNDLSILPPGARVSPQLEVIGSLRFDRFAPLSAVLFVRYARNPNRGVFQDTSGMATPVLITSDGVNVQLLVHAAF